MLRTNCTPLQFAIFRIVFGIYLAWHFYTLVPYAPELFGPNGMIPDTAIIPSWGILPSVLHLIPGDLPIQIFISLLGVASVLFAAGFYRRTFAIFIWYGWAYLLNRNVLISNPGIPYVGWLLLACAVIPSGEGYYLWSKTPSNKFWHMPEFIYFGAWFLMAMGYTISGIHKLQCPSWIDGTALQHILSSALSRNNWLCNLLLTSPPIVLKIHTWFSLVAEILFLPLGLFYHVRKWYWLLFICIHFGVLCLINFTDLTLGVLMIHFFTFDSLWLNQFPFTFSHKENKKIV